MRPQLRLWIGWHEHWGQKQPCFYRVAHNDGWRETQKFKFSRKLCILCLGE